MQKEDGGEEDPEASAGRLDPMGSHVSFQVIPYLVDVARLRLCVRSLMPELCARAVRGRGGDGAEVEGAGGGALEEDDKRGRMVADRPAVLQRSRRVHDRDLQLREPGAGAGGVCRSDTAAGRPP